MEHSTFQRKLIPSGTDAAAMKVHSKEKPPDFRMRLTKVFLRGKKTAQLKAVFQVIIADGCLCYGNDALRSRGGCCICLLMASGLIAKRFSMWVADASEGEITHTTFSKRLKLAVFIILPRLVTSHPCGQSKMDDTYGCHEKTIKDFLTFAVRLLSRLHVGKTNGQEICWKNSPPDWPEHLLGPWKNPTSAPKDNTDRLRGKYKYLRMQVPSHKLKQEELKAFEDFEQGKIKSVKSFMCYNTLTDKIDIKHHLSDMEEHHLMLLKKHLKLAKDQVSSLLSSKASTSRSQTAANTSSPSTLSRKRKSDDSLISVQSKKQNIRRQKAEPKPTPTASSESLPVFAQNGDTLKSTAVESVSEFTAFPNQSLWSLISSKNTLSNTNMHTSECTTSSNHTGAAAVTNVWPSIVTSPIVIMYTTNTPLPCSSHEEPSRTVSHCIRSVDSGTWSQESNIESNIKETFIEFDHQKLSDKSVQDNLQSIENSQNNDFDPKIFINFYENT